MLVPDTQIRLILLHAQLWDLKCFLELLPDFHLSWAGTPGLYDCATSHSPELAPLMCVQ